jgi:lactoylglutathione lyase
MWLERDGRLWLVCLRIDDDQHLEVFPEATSDAAPELKALGYNHMCFAVPDIEKMVRELEEAGVALIRPKIQGADGNWQTWIADPDGHQIQHMQMAPDGMQA